MADQWTNPSNEPNTSRDERERVREELEARLMRSGVHLTGSESDAQIVALSNAVDDMDTARARLGGDSMVDTPDSSQPEDSRLVLPLRRDDESVDQYVSRIRAAARRLTGAEPG